MSNLLGRCGAVSVLSHRAIDSCFLSGADGQPQRDLPLLASPCRGRLYRVLLYDPLLPYIDNSRLPRRLLCLTSPLPCWGRLVVPFWVPFWVPFCADALTPTQSPHLLAIYTLSARPCQTQQHYECMLMDESDYVHPSYYHSPPPPPPPPPRRPPPLPSFSSPP